MPQQEVDGELDRELGQATAVTPLIECLTSGEHLLSRVKPFNFLLSAVVNPIDRPPRKDGFQLIAPYSRNPLEWLRSRWVDLHSSEIYSIRADGVSSRIAIRVQTIADVLERFRDHQLGNPAGGAS